MKNIGCNIKRCTKIVLISIVLFAICSFFAFFEYRKYMNLSIFNNDAVYYIYKVLMIFCSIFFGFGLSVVAVKLLFYRDKMIEFLGDCLVDNSSFVFGGKIDYLEIDSVFVKGMFLCIKVKNEKQYLKRQNFLKRFLMRINKKNGYEYVTISSNFLDTDLLELEKLINEKLTSSKLTNENLTSEKVTNEKNMSEELMREELVSEKLMSEEVSD